VWGEILNLAILNVDDLEAMALEMFERDRASWAGQFYKAYRSIAVFPELKETAHKTFSEVLKRLLFHENKLYVRQGASWIIGKDEFLGPLKHSALRDWGADGRTAINVIEVLENAADVMTDTVRHLGGDQPGRTADGRVKLYVIGQGALGAAHVEPDLELEGVGETHQLRPPCFSIHAACAAIASAGVCPVPPSPFDA
jgi:hypothetical protein